MDNRMKKGTGLICAENRAPTAGWSWPHAAKEPPPFSSTRILGFQKARVLCQALMLGLREVVHGSLAAAKSA
jgi:hypothetical protein